MGRYHSVALSGLLSTTVALAWSPTASIWGAEPGRAPSSTAPPRGTGTSGAGWTSSSRRRRSRLGMVTSTESQVGKDACLPLKELWGRRDMAIVVRSHLRGIA